jgi:hypothetical protein
VAGQGKGKGVWSVKRSERALFVEMHRVMVSSEVRETA